MTKNITILVSLALILTSCAKQSSEKIKNITFFTPVLKVDDGAPSVHISSVQQSTSWEEGVNWINKQPKSFKIEKLSNKFDSFNIAKGNLIAAPIIAEGKLFTISDKGYLTSYDAANNKMLWSVALNTRESKSVLYYHGAMSYSEGKIYITNATRDLIVVDSSSGAILWRYKMLDISKTQPVIYKNMIIITTVSNELYAMDKTTGAILWENEGLVETLSVSRDIAPIVHDGKVIVGYSSGQLVCLDASSGNVLWEINLSGEGSIIPGFVPVSLESQPIVENSSIYLSGANGKMLKININNGSIEWQKEISDIQSISKSGNTLFVTTNAMQIAAVNDKTGDIIWVTNLFELNKSSKSFLRKKTPKTLVLLSPIVVNDYLFVNSSGGKLYKLSPYDGSIVEVVDIAKDAQYLIVTEDLNIFTKSKRLKFRRDK